MDKIDEEIWKPIIGYEGIYEISSFGRVKALSVVRNKWFGEVVSKERIMKPYLGKNKYHNVSLHKERTLKRVYIHRIVAEAFIDNPDNKKDVNHKDGVRWNNNLNNLEWATRSENKLHAYRTGISKAVTGEKHGKAKLRETDVRTIRFLINDFGYKDTVIANLFDMHPYSISQIRNKKIWRSLIYNGKEYSRNK